MPPFSRRTFLAGSAAAAALSLGDPFRLFLALAENLPLPRELRKADRHGLLPFVGEGETPFQGVRGEGHDARRAFDLSTLEPGRMVTPTDHFFLRTDPPPGMPEGDFWPLASRALDTNPEQIFLAELREMAEPMGVHLLSCVKNGPEHHFGLASAAEWTGVPMRRLFERTRLPEEDWELLVEGYDHRIGIKVSPEPGASWIFRPNYLQRSGAFLATGMNGGPLPREHGGPLRLVVPGWQGYTWIKWVYTLVFVPAKHTAPTPHMAEYWPNLKRAGQERRLPRRASAFPRATVGRTAVPVRVEHWCHKRRHWARIVGAVWGGETPPPEIRIRVRPDDKFEPVDDYQPSRVPETSWALWSHTVRIKDPGRYAIQLGLDAEGESPKPVILDDFTRTFEIRFS